MLHRISDVLSSQRLEILFRILELLAGVEEACEASETTRDHFGEKMIPAGVMTVWSLMRDTQFARDITQTEVLYTFFGNDIARSLNASFLEVNFGARIFFHPNSGQCRLHPIEQGVDA
jgi:hypothetical protein